MYAVVHQHTVHDVCPVVLSAIYLPIAGTCQACAVCVCANTCVCVYLCTCVAVCVYLCVCIELNKGMTAIFNVLDAFGNIVLF